MVIQLESEYWIRLDWEQGEEAIQDYVQNLKSCKITLPIFPAMLGFIQGL